MADEASRCSFAWAVTPLLVKPYVGNLTQTPMDSQVPGEHFYETIQMLQREPDRRPDVPRWAGTSAGPR